MFIRAGAYAIWSQVRGKGDMKAKVTQSLLLHPRAAELDPLFVLYDTIYDMVLASIAPRTFASLSPLSSSSSTPSSSFSSFRRGPPLWRLVVWITCAERRYHESWFSRWVSGSSSLLGDTRPETRKSRVSRLILPCHVASRVRDYRRTENISLRRLRWNLPRAYRRRRQCVPHFAARNFLLGS